MDKVRDEAELNIPLQKINFDADVVGMFAQVTCEQEFENKNDVPVEAVYVFPMPEDASIAGCEMVIGDKRIEAELKEKEQAKQEYDDAVAAGHYAGLLEQKRDNIFRINVGGIEPGDNIKIVTTYNQRVPWQDDGGRFSIPLVVAPRFIPGEPSGTKTGGGWAEDTDEVPDASEITPVVAKEGVSYTADIKVVLSPGFKCHISSPSHEMVENLVTENSGDETRFDVIDLDIDEPAKPITIEIKDLVPDRDFIVCYQTKSDHVEAGVHAGTFEGEEYIVLDVIPPGVAVAKPKDVIFCLDVSGSMDGAKLAGLKVVAEKVAKRLGEQDEGNRVGIVAFDHDIHPELALSKVYEATYSAIQELESQGGTMAGKALDYCFQELSGENSREKYILIVSDGQTADMWSKVVPGIRVVSVGIDTAVNMSYLKDIARETKGVSLAVYPGEDYDEVASTLVGYLAGPVLQDIEVVADGRTLTNALGVADVYTSMPASLTLRIATPETLHPSNIQLVGTDSQGKKSVVVVDMQDAVECSFAHQIWAREKLRDQTLEADAIVALSLKYSVLCNKTAFVAVYLKETPGQAPVRVEVPVALPSTWDYDKVFGEEVAIGGITLRGAHAIGGPRGQSISHAFVSRSAQGMTLGEPAQGISLSHSSSSSSSTSATGDGYRPPGIYPESIISKGVQSVDLADLVDKLEQGSIGRDTADTLWESIETQLTESAVESWSVEQKAETFYYLLKLRTFGYHVAKEVLKLLAVEPASSDTVAHEWWEKAQQVLGVAV